MSGVDPEELADEYEVENDDVSDLRQRTFLERHDWIPWIAAAILVGATTACLQIIWAGNDPPDLTVLLPSR